MSKRTQKILISLMVAAGMSFVFCHFALAENTNIAIAPPYSNEDANSFLANVLKKIQEIVGYLAVMFIVIGGAMYMMSGGNENMAKMAKACWTAALIGIAVVAVAPSFLKEIKDVAFGGSVPTTFESIPGAKDIVMRGLSFLLSIVGTLAIIGIVISGIAFLTAGVNKNQADIARRALQYSIIGIILAGLSLALVKEIAGLLT